MLAKAQLTSGPVYRLLTYNVHRCIGTDGKLSPGRIAEVIAAAEPDVVALQELDVRRARTGHIDQAEEIAGRLGMEMHFHPSMRVFEELYGDAILTPQPSRLVRAGPLPGLASRPQLEPRGALWVAVELGGQECGVVNTHLGLRGAERSAQVEALLGPDWLGAGPNDPCMVVGDLNALRWSRAYRRLAARFSDAQCGAARRPRATFPSCLPLLRLDHIFTSPSIQVLRTDTLRTPVARRASDHLPLLIEFGVRPAAVRQAGGAA
ncbi:MAG: endonuclease [Enterovirga sp.]|nr:endonuclease [Enterovirga sp.]